MKPTLTCFLACVYLTQAHVLRGKIEEVDEDQHDLRIVGGTVADPDSYPFFGTTIFSNPSCLRRSILTLSIHLQSSWMGWLWRFVDP